MRLEMGHIYIKDIQFADESKIQDGVLYVSKEELEKKALEDEKIKECLLTLPVRASLFASHL